MKDKWIRKMIGCGSLAGLLLAASVFVQASAKEEADCLLEGVEASLVKADGSYTDFSMAYLDDMSLAEDALVMAGLAPDEEGGAAASPVDGKGRDNRKKGDLSGNAGDLSGNAKNSPPTKPDMVLDLSKDVGCRVIAKTRGGKLETEDLGALAVVIGPENHYALRFATPHMAEGAVKKLEEMESVEYARQDTLVFPTGSLAPASVSQKAAASANTGEKYKSWGAKALGIPEMAKTIGGSPAKANRVLVAVIDTGLTPDANIFKGRVVKGYNFFRRNDNTKDILDRGDYHGTHVAGTIVDCSQDLPQIQVMPVSVFGNMKIGGKWRVAASSSAVCAGMAYSMERGAMVLNMSLGGEAPDPYKTEMVKKATAQGRVVVVASGNDNEDMDNYSPSDVKEAICVTAVDKKYKRSWFSNFGSKADFAGPGLGIVSYQPGAKLKALDGTSMAAPHITSLVAMIKMAHPGYTAGQVEAMLKGYCKDLGRKGWDQWYGNGIPQMAKFRMPTTYTVKYRGTGVTNLPAILRFKGGQKVVVSKKKPTKKITITFKAEGGKVKTASKRLSVPFSGKWKGSDGRTYRGGQTYDRQANLLLTACWKRVKVGDLPKAYRKGYVFKGWYTKKKGGQKVSVKEAYWQSQKLYAQWKKK